MERVEGLLACPELVLHVEFQFAYSLRDDIDLRDAAVSAQSRNSAKSLRRSSGEGVSKINVSFRRINRLRVVSIQKYVNLAFSCESVQALT